MLNVKIPWQNFGIIKIIYFYRYISLVLTSVFYLAAGPEAPMIYKIGVILSLLIASKIITDLYIKYRDCPAKLKPVILTETIGIIVLLVPTGGVESMFIWYALNPVLVAASFLSPYFCWFNLVFYLICSTFISVELFNPNNETFITLILQKAYLILVFILITLAVQMLSALMRRLQKANDAVEESMEHIMSLYHIVEAFSSGGKPEILFDTVVKYAAELTKSPCAFFFRLPNIDKSAGSFISVGEINNKTCQELTGRIETLGCKETKTGQLNLRICEKEYLLIAVNSSFEHYGFLGIELHRSINQETCFKHLKFLADLSGVVLERISLEKLSDRLLIIEEQNRIAEEIHDSVSQRLFSISCAIHVLKNNWPRMERKVIEEQLDLIQESSNKSVHELRALIYNLSSKKSGQNEFFKGIKSYLESAAKLNDIQINVETTGDEDLISWSLKKALFRIISEATGNAVRHGRSKKIDVSIVINHNCTELSIIDDGRGFDLKKAESLGSGLGISNMKNITAAFKGEFEIKSSFDKGTAIFVKIPNDFVISRVKKGVA